MGCGSYVMPLAVRMTKSCLANVLELRLLNLSAEKTLKHAEGSAKTAQYSTEMSNALDAIKAKLSDDPTSEEYRQNMAECESVENEYTMIIEAIRDQMEQVEERIDTMIQTVETQYKVVQEEEEQWKEVANQKAENNCPFQNA